MPTPPGSGVARRQGSRTPTPATNLDPVGLLKALRRRWLLATGVGLLCGALAAVATWFLLPVPKHSVRTLIQVPPGNPFLFKTAEPVPDLASHQKNQMALVKSRLVLVSALRDPRVAKLGVVTRQAERGVDPVEWLEREVQVDFSVAPEDLRISMSGQDTDDLVVLVNALREAYRKELVDQERGERQKRLEKLIELRTQYEQRLQALRETQKGLEEKIGARDATVRSRMHAFTEQQLGMSEQELLRTQFQLRRDRLELQTLQPREQKVSDLKAADADLDEILSKDPTVRERQEEVRTLEEVISKTLERVVRGEQDPSVRRYRTQLATVKRDLEALQQRLRPEAISRLRDRARFDLQAKVAILQARIATLEETEKMLTPEVQRLQNRVGELSRQGIKLDAFQEDTSQWLDLTKSLTAEEQKLKIELGAPSRIKVLEDAIVTRVDAKSRQMQMAGVAALAGLAFGLFGVSWLEYRTQRIDTAAEVVGGLGVRLVATLPDALSFSGSGYSSPEAEGHSLMTESVDTARAMLLHIARQQALRVVMVTSAVAGEGKTSLVCQLAVSLARAGINTLVIDGDLRNPTTHRLFGVSRGPGFCEVLRGEVEAADVIHPTEQSDLSLLPAGQWDGQIIRALAQGRTGEVLDQLRKEYDFILIDSSPILPVADGLLIGQHTDGTLLSILRGVSRLPSVEAAIQRIEALSIRSLGVVVSGVRVEGYAYAYPHTVALDHKVGS